MTIQRAGAIGLAPLILNPATLAALAVGAVGYGLYRLLGEEEQKEEPKRITHAPVRKPKVAENGTQDKAAVSESTTPNPNADPETVTNREETLLETTPDNKELIRQAMSELGRKSAAARARKKAALEAGE